MYVSDDNIFFYLVLQSLEKASNNKRKKSDVIVEIFSGGNESHDLETEDHGNETIDDNNLGSPLASSPKKRT